MEQEKGLANYLETKFNRIFKELAELKEALTQIQSEPNQTQHNLSPKVTGFSQRTGSYKPEDVAIEKFFYAGQK